MQARGALLRGLDGSMVKERRARRSYGTTSDNIAATEYTHEEGNKRYRYYDHEEDVYRIKDHLTWFIKKVSLVS